MFDRFKGKQAEPGKLEHTYYKYKLLRNIAQDAVEATELVSGIQEKTLGRPANPKDKKAMAVAYFALILKDLDIKDVPTSLTELLIEAAVGSIQVHEETPFVIDIETDN